IGLADVTTLRAVNKIDFVATYTNAVTATTFGLKRSTIPITMADDERALAVAVRTCGAAPGSAVSFVFARNTLTVENLWVSAALRAQVEKRQHDIAVADGRLAGNHKTNAAASRDGCVKVIRFA
ncbi:MAG: hypothetical protein RL334_1531, partial [Chloroflexota bacterium]